MNWLLYFSREFLHVSQLKSQISTTHLSLLLSLILFFFSFSLCYLCSSYRQVYVTQKNIIMSLYLKQFSVGLSTFTHVIKLSYHMVLVRFSVAYVCSICLIVEFKKYVHVICRWLWIVQRIIKFIHKFIHNKLIHVSNIWSVEIVTSNSMDLCVCNEEKKNSYKSSRYTGRVENYQWYFRVLHPRALNSELNY